MFISLLQVTTERCRPFKGRRHIVHDDIRLVRLQKRERIGDAALDLV
jgi:hypothetical protein